MAIKKHAPTIKRTNLCWMDRMIIEFIILDDRLNSSFASLNCKQNRFKPVNVIQLLDNTKKTHTKSLIGCYYTV